MSGARPLSSASPAGEALVRRTLRRLVVVALGYRAFVTVVAVTITATSPELAASSMRSLILVGAAVVLLHLGLISLASRRDLRTAGHWAVAADLSLAVALNVWASAVVIPQDALYRGFGDPFGAYAIGTLALWSALRGPKAGARYLMAVMVPLQFAMAAANRATLTSSDWARFAMRGLWLVAALAVGSLLWNVLRRGRMALTAQSELVGRQAQRRRTLDALHNVVLQTLIGIERRASDTGVDVEAALREIAIESNRRAGQMRRLLDVGNSEGPGVRAGLELVVDELVRPVDMQVMVHWEGPEPSLAPDAIEALVGAVGEAVRNAGRHGGARRIAIEAAVRSAELIVVVRDDGRGFDGDASDEGYGIRHAIRERLADAGGSARLLPSVDGAAWELTIPALDGPRSGRSNALALRPLVDATVASAAFIPLSYRLIGLLIAGAGLIGSRSLGPVRLAPVLVLLTGLAIAHIVLIAACARGSAAQRRNWIIACDVVLLVAASLWTASALTAGTVFLDNRDPFTVYAQGTVALWTGFGSSALGLGLLLGFALPLQLAGAAVNGVALGSVDWLILVTRGMWFVAAFLLARGIVSVVRKGGALLAEERHRAGAEAERAAALEASGNEVLATLDDIARLAHEQREGPSVALPQVGALARRRAADVRLMLRTGQLTPGLQAQLESLAAQCDGHGTVNVELVTVDLHRRAATAATARLLDAVREVLDEASTLGPRRNLTVFAEDRDRRVRAVVNDPWPGADDQRLRQVLSTRLADAGGGVGGTRTGARGVTWELWVREPDPNA